jgi:hypothetical protein
LRQIKGIAEDIAMNSSLFTCDRATHLKIVAIALVASIVVIAVGIHARTDDSGSLAANAKTSGMVVKAGKLAIYSTRNDSAVR